MISVDIVPYATMLLIVRLLSMALIGAVIYKQLQLFKLPIDKEISHYRQVLFVLAVAIFIGNIIPAYIDIATILGDVTRSTKTVNGVGLLYSLDSAFTSLLASFLIFRLYRLAATTDESHRDSEHVLMNDENK